MKRLFSLLLVVSSFSWSSLLRSSSYEGQGDLGFTETKGEVAVHMPVTLKYLDQDGAEHSVVVPAAQISSFNLIKTMLPEDGEEAGELEIPIASQVGSLAAFRFLEAYLQNPDQALKLLSEMPGEQIVDALQLLEYLQFDFFTPVGQKLQVELLAQLRKKLSPEVIVHAWGKLGSLRLLEFRGGELMGNGVGWSPDGQRLLVRRSDNDGDRFRIYQISQTGELVQLGGEVMGNGVGWSSDGQRLWIGRFEDEVSKIRIYQVNPTGELGQLGGTVDGFAAGWSPDGQSFWVVRCDNWLDKIRIYQINLTGELVQLGEDDLGDTVGWSPDGQWLWIRRFENRIGQIQIFNTGLLELQKIPHDLWNKLTLAQELLLLYLVREKQATGEVYKLLSNPKLWPVWMSLSGELREYLVRDGYVGRDHRTLKRTIPKF